MMPELYWAEMGFSRNVVVRDNYIAATWGGLALDLIIPYGQVPGMQMVFLGRVPLFSTYDLQLSLIT